MLSLFPPKLCAKTPHYISAIIMVFVLIATVIACPTYGQDAPFSSPDNAPIEITAQTSLEWYRDKGLYVARGAAKAVRGSVTVAADVLTAREASGGAEKSALSADEGKTTKIDILGADGNVVISNGDRTIVGDRATYDLRTGRAIVTGKALRYSTPTESVTARDALEYHERESVAVARGDAIAEKGDRRLRADVLTAQFQKTAEGKTDLTRMAAHGHVVITTASDVVSGNQATWDMQRNTAVVTGNVRIKRGGDTTLSGDRAEVDVAKGQSTLSAIGKGKRATAVLSNSDNEAKNRD